MLNRARHRMAYKCGFVYKWKYIVYTIIRNSRMQVQILTWRHSNLESLLGSTREMYLNNVSLQRENIDFSWWLSVEPWYQAYLRVNIWIFVNNATKFFWHSWFQSHLIWKHWLISKNQIGDLPLHANLFHWSEAQKWSPRFSLAFPVNNSFSGSS